MERRKGKPPEVLRLRQELADRMAEWAERVVADGIVAARELEPQIHILVHRLRREGPCLWCNHLPEVVEALK